MRRREFVARLGAAAWPLGARAQQPEVPVVGYLRLGTLETTLLHVVGFRRGLSEAGFVEGRNLAVEYRWVDYRPAATPRNLGLAHSRRHDCMSPAAADVSTVDTLPADQPASGPASAGPEHGPAWGKAVTSCRAGRSYMAYDAALALCQGLGVLVRKAHAPSVAVGGTEWALIGRPSRPSWIS
jgi:hypothetical protein